METTSDADTLWNVFKEGLSEGIKIFIPHKTTKTKDSQPWIDLDLKRKIRRRNRAYRASKKHGRLKDEIKFQKLKKEVQRDLRRAYWSYVEGIITPQAEDSSSYGSMKRFWTFIKHKKADYNGVTSLRVDGKLLNDAKQKARGTKPSVPICLHSRKPTSMQLLQNTTFHLCQISTLAEPVS